MDWLEFGAFFEDAQWYAVDIQSVLNVLSMLKICKICVRTHAKNKLNRTGNLTQVYQLLKGDLVSGFLDFLQCWWGILCWTLSCHPHFRHSNNTGFWDGIP